MLLNDYCTVILTNAAKRYTGSVYLFFNILNSTGIRANELLEIDRWSMDKSNNFVLLSPSKFSNQRIFQAEDFPNVFIQAIKNQLNIFPLSSLSSYSYIFKQLRPYPIILSDKKQLLLHTFRHNYIKLKWSQNSDYNDIKQLTGIKRDETIDHYINAVFYQKTPTGLIQI